jgi:hypothetical protein
MDSHFSTVRTWNQISGSKKMLFLKPLFSPLPLASWSVQGPPTYKPNLKKKVQPPPLILLSFITFRLLFYFMAVTIFLDGNQPNFSSESGWSFCIYRPFRNEVCHLKNTELGNQVAKYIQRCICLTFCN